MIKLLIVDDEPYTVEGLFDMLNEVEDLTLELFTATSARDAIQRLTRTRIDIVISDIQMPGMSGLELQNWIVGRWPRCKIIFLTGYGHLHYAQQAIRGGSIDYILKTEGDEAIVSSVRAAIQAIVQDTANDQYLLRAKGQLLQALPLLRKEWFFELIGYKMGDISLRDTKLQQLKSELSIAESVMLVGGRVDLWGENDGYEQQALLLYAVQNGAEFVWLIQPSDMQTTNELWEDTTSYVLASMESVQRVCREILKISISLIYTGFPVSWDRLGTAYGRLKQTMILGVGSGQEMLISYCEDGSRLINSNSYRNVIADLGRCLEANQDEAFRRTAESLFEQIPNRIGLYAQAYFGIAVLLLEQLNNMVTLDETAEGGIRKLLDIHAHRSKDDALKLLLDTASLLFDRRRSLQDERTNRIIVRLNQYIKDHLSSDLSLDTLADLVHMNSSYLSNLYKQSTGKNISDYIIELRIEKAKDMLRNSSYKIHEIADLMGFGAAPYFTRYFKRHVGITPQEYRG
jgi:two-component system response regulator YesN